MTIELRPRRPLLCRLNVHHSWKWCSTDDGDRFQQCVRCGKDKIGGAGGGTPGSFAAFGPGF